MLTILLIRHGENDVMKTRLAGRLPGIHLNTKGVEQAESLSFYLKALPLQAVYTSPLERARETAQPLADQMSLNVHIHHGLNEIDFGIWQGKTYHYLNRLKKWQTVIQFPSQVTFPGGESYIDAQNRVIGSLREIEEKHQRHSHVACFTHADVIRLAVAHYLGMPLDHIKNIWIEPATITELQIENSKVILNGIGQKLFIG